MSANDPMFSAISDLESCTFALEDLQNLQTVFQDRLNQWGSEVDATKPWTSEFFAKRLPLLLSLHCTISEKLAATLADMNQGVKAAYDAYSARKNQ